MFPVVVVEVGMPEAPPQYERVLLDACTRALRQGRCVVGDAGLEPKQPRAVAIVSWEEDQQRARIEVGVRDTSDKEQWLSRQLRFDAIDAPIERWRSVGLTIASLVGELPRSESAEPTTSPPVGATTTRSSETTPSHEPVTGSQVAVPPLVPKLFAELGFSGGPGLVTGPYRAGGYVRLGYLPEGTPLTIALGGRLTVRPAESRELRVRWIDLSLEMGAHAEFANAQVGASGVLLLQEIRAAAPAPDNESDDSQARWVPGFGLRADVAWPARAGWAIVLGAEGRLLAAQTSILNAGEQVAETSVLEGLLEVGVRLRW